MTLVLAADCQCSQQQIQDRLAASDAATYLSRHGAAAGTTQFDGYGSSGLLNPLGHFCADRASVRPNLKGKKEKVHTQYAELQAAIKGWNFIAAVGSALVTIAAPGAKGLGRRRARA